MPSEPFDVNERVDLLRGLESFQIQLSGGVDLGHDAALFVLDAHATGDAELATLKAGGSVVACYFSAGSFEPWRPDAADFAPEALGEPLDGYPDERWIDVTHEGAVELMHARVRAAADRGCDGVYPVVLVPEGEATGFSFGAEQLDDFARGLVQTAHAAGMFALGSGAALAPAALPPFDGELVFGCIERGTCESWLPFSEQGAVFLVEFGSPDDAQASCPAVPSRWPVIIKSENLDSFRYVCP